MKVLLDTHVFLWYSAGDPRLSDYARSIVEDDMNVRLLSAASLIEIAIKQSLGRLILLDSFEQFINTGILKLNCSIVNITVPQLNRLSVLPFHHRDPFDRMLVAQALVDDIAVVSADKVLDSYGVRRHWKAVQT